MCWITGYYLAIIKKLKKKKFNWFLQKKRITNRRLEFDLLIINFLNYTKLYTILIYKHCYGSKPRRFFLCKLERNKKERVWKDGFRNCVSQVRAQRRAASRTHFYGFGIWVNVPKRRLFPRAVRSSVLIRVKELNPSNSRLDHVRSLKARKRRARSLSLN